MPYMNMPYGGDRNYGTRKPFGKKAQTQPRGMGQQSGQSGSGYSKFNTTSQQSTGSQGIMKRGADRPNMAPKGRNTGY